MPVARPVETRQQGGSVVARYYFDTYDGRNWSEDEQGPDYLERHLSVILQEQVHVALLRFQAEARPALLDRADANVGDEAGPLLGLDYLRGQHEDKHQTA